MSSPQQGQGLIVVSMSLDGRLYGRSGGTSDGTSEGRLDGKRSKMVNLKKKKNIYSLLLSIKAY